jgi:hypothetical protein
MAGKAKGKKPIERKNLSVQTRTAVLTESGYRCAVPTCRQILALDLHHIYQVKDGGGDDPANLIALCPSDHALYHRGTISSDSIYAYKAMLVAIGRAFDLEAIDRLLFLGQIERDFLLVSGDGLLHFSRLVTAGLASVELKAHNNWMLASYAVNISDKGKLLIDAWRQGDRVRLKNVLSGPIPAAKSGGLPT